MSKLPLEGVSIVDMTHAWSGPHATRVLADFGAEVIVVEYPRRLGLLRGGKTEDQAYNQQPTWFQVFRNKYSVTLDLDQPTARDILTDLLKQADVLVNNSRSGVLDRLGFGREALLQAKPDLITLAMPAYGSNGPLAPNPAYGAALEVMSGIQNLTAYGPGQKPQRIKEMDVLNGLGGAAAILTALLYRKRTGKGQHIDLSQLEFATHSSIGEHLLEHVLTGQHTPPVGNRHRRFAPQGCYRSQGEDCWVALTVRSDEQWQRLCAAIGKPSWKQDPRFATAAGRMQHHDEIDRGLEEWTKARSHLEAMEALQAHAVPSGAVLNGAEIAEDPHLAARGYFQGGVAGTDKPMMGLPFRLSRTPGSVRWRGPDLGQHNEQVVCQKLSRPKSDVPQIIPSEIGTAYDPE